MRKAVESLIKKNAVYKVTDASVRVAAEVIKEEIAGGAKSP